jgi:hypothetical protein
MAEGLDGVKPIMTINHNLTFFLAKTEIIQY